MPSTRTPEGERNRCPVCGKGLVAQVSRPPGDTTCPHCGSLLWAREPRTGRLSRIGRYNVKRELSRGGMGVVYAGRDDQLDRLVAIKVLAPSLANDEFRQRFFHEVRTLAQLHHPCIVTIYEAGEHDGQLFYAMELVGNSTLEDALRAGRTFDWREVVSIGIDAAQALACLHRCGIIHRNVCPDNLIPSDNGRVKMIGFGMAKVFGAAASSDTAALLTVDYMAPEQADGSSITPRADLYCLGTTLFKLLTGRSPFAGRSIAKTLHNMRYEEAPRVRSLAPDVPEGLDELSARLLKKDPQERVSTAQVLEKQLQGLAESDH